MRNLGIFIDDDLSMRHHVDVITARCYASLRQLRAVRRFVLVPVTQSLVTSLAITRLRYCSCVPLGLPATTTDICNPSRTLLRAWCSTYFGQTTSALICLHWLRVYERVLFKVAVTVFWSLLGSAPPYL
jgi:hypothetical protein